VLNELNDDVKINLQILAELTDQFNDAQKSLEGDAFGTGSLFIGTLCAIRHNIEKLRQQQPTAVAAFERQVDDPAAVVGGSAEPGTTGRANRRA
jgi:hypothetical protein